ncbi:thermonuclease family protein [Sphingobium fuliginis]|uniref:thermonuclease family protein n=1 Tax=Sphingobium fuliginis (strain ATCC 27551) TaxID=336203 RepID=UPI0037CAF12D
MTSDVQYRRFLFTRRGFEVRRGHNRWSTTDQRYWQKGRASRKDRSDPIVLLLSATFVLSVGMLVFLWPSSPISALSGRSSTGDGGFSCQVASITDGDTLRCTDGTRVRLHAVAAREKDESCSPGHPCPASSGAAATAKLSELAGGQSLQCRQTGSSYGRVTAICDNAAGVEINCAMVESGVALVWPKFNRQQPICS